jgi:fatty-acyl-CoA synthase
VSAETLPAAWRDAVLSYGERTAIVGDSGRLTFSELDDSATALATALAETGGPSVVIAAPNDRAFVVALLAAAIADKIAIPLDPATSAQSVLEMVDANEARSVVVSPKLSVPIIDALEDRAIVVHSEKGVIAKAARAHETPDDVPTSGMSEASAPAATRPVVMFQTSGTGARPAAVLHSHGSVLNSFHQYQLLKQEFFSDTTDTPQQVTLVAQSFFLIAGAATLIRSLLSGDSVISTRAFHPRRILHLVERERVEVLTITPTMAEFLLRTRYDAFDSSSLQVIGLGGSSTSEMLCERLRDAFDCLVTVGYGSTELGGPVIVGSPIDGAVEGIASVGRVLPGVSARIVDEQGAETEVGEVGELECRSAGLMLGYKREDGTVEEAGGADGWFRTHDLARRTDDGRILIVGRADDVIVKADKKYAACQIEDVLNSHPGVELSAVVTTPDDGAGTRIRAFVACSDGSIESQTLIDWCRRHLPSVLVPDEAVFVDAIPLTRDGKLMKSKLLERHRGG